MPRRPGRSIVPIALLVLGAQPALAGSAPITVTTGLHESQPHLSANMPIIGHAAGPSTSPLSGGWEVFVADLSACSDEVVTRQGRGNRTAVPGVVPADLFVHPAVHPNGHVMLWQRPLGEGAAGVTYEIILGNLPGSWGAVREATVRPTVPGSNDFVTPRVTVAGFGTRNFVAWMSNHPTNPQGFVVTRAAIQSEESTDPTSDVSLSVASFDFKLGINELAETHSALGEFGTSAAGVRAATANATTQTVVALRDIRMAFPTSSYTWDSMKLAVEDTDAGTHVPDPDDVTFVEISDAGFAAWSSQFDYCAPPGSRHMPNRDIWVWRQDGDFTPTDADGLTVETCDLPPQSGSDDPPQGKLYHIIPDANGGDETKPVIDFRARSVHFLAGGALHRVEIGTPFGEPWELREVASEPGGTITHASVNFDGSVAAYSVTTPAGGSDVRLVNSQVPSPAATPGGPRPPHQPYEVDVTTCTSRPLGFGNTLLSMTAAVSKFRGGPRDLVVLFEGSCGLETRRLPPRVVHLEDDERVELLASVILDCGLSSKSCDVSVVDGGAIQPDVVRDSATSR